MKDRFVEGEGLDRAEIPRPLHPDSIPRVKEDLRDQVKALLRPVHDLDLIRHRRETEPPPVTIGDELPKRKVTIGRRVLKRHPPLPGKDRPGRIADPLKIDVGRTRQPARKRDHPRDRRDPEELIEERLRDPRHPIRKSIGHMTSIGCPDRRMPGIHQGGLLL